MLNTVHYTLKTVSSTNGLPNAEVTYDVYYDAVVGIAYQVELKAPPTGFSRELETVWRAKIVNEIGELRLEYDLGKKIYYQTKQTIQVESPLYNLQEDVRKFLESARVTPVEDLTITGKTYPGFKLNTLTIWIDPEQFLPVRRVNLDRGNLIVDDFTYDIVNGPLLFGVFDLPKSPEAIADFDLYPEAPTLPRFENVTEQPRYGVYVETLLEQVKRFVIANQWEYGPFATVLLPWLTEMPVTIYRSRSENTFPPLVVVFDVPMQGRTYFLVTYDYLGYVVSGFTQTGYDLSGYEELPIQATVMLRDFVPLYAAPSYEKNFVVNNFVKSVQSNDTFIDAFDMGGKLFGMTIKNFSFQENEGYLLLNVYGKEYWDTANLEAMFNYVTTGQMFDAHTTPIIIYALNSLKRLGIYEPMMMPQYQQLPGGEEFARNP